MSVTRLLLKQGGKTNFVEIFPPFRKGKQMSTAPTLYRGHSTEVLNGMAETASFNQVTFVRGVLRTSAAALV
jgi:hypothetical protein